jgi:hypothetical protein
VLCQIQEVVVVDERGDGDDDTPWGQAVVLVAVVSRRHIGILT